MTPQNINVLIFKVLILLATAFLPSLSQADEFFPALFKLTEINTDHFEATWKRPFNTQANASKLTVRIIDEKRNPAETLIKIDADEQLQHRNIYRAGGLSGTTISIDGLSQNSTVTLLQIQYVNGDSLVHRLTPETPSYTVPQQQTSTRVIQTYTFLGIEHILIGADHLLFVLVLIMLIKGWRKLVLTISSFTVSHSITLSLSALSIVHVPIAPVEACIALSILFVAIEIVNSQQGHKSITERKPWLIAFIFGLLHGLGFAAAISEIGLPKLHLLEALVFFNIGVEIGQILFVAAVLVVTRIVQNLSSRVSELVNKILVYLIGSVAAFWTIERIAAF